MLSKRKDKWRNAERHYCSVCNAWMGGDKQSILIHENGKKHRENAELQMKRRREEKIRKKKEEAEIQASLRVMKKVAAEAHAKDMVSIYGIVPNPTSSSVPRSCALPLQTNAPQQLPPLGPLAAPISEASGVSHSLTSQKVAGHEKKIEVDKLKGNKGGADGDEVVSWQARKRKREVMRFSDGVKEKGEDNLSTEPNSFVAKTRRRLAGNEGHYSLHGKTYLEGPVYAAIVEEEMPAQLWTGPLHKEEDMRKEENDKFWKSGLVTKVVRKEAISSEENVKYTFDFAYLLSPDDEEETMEHAIDPARLRIVVGSGASVPGSVEEARLALMGGEEVVTFEQGLDAKLPDIDENTGFTRFTTVSIRRVTSNQEEKKEKERARERKREAAERKARDKEELEERKMEEAKHANADDSALGAYDVWASGKGGYKGVDISKEMKVDATDAAKSLSKGKINVVFKKRSGAAGSANVGSSAGRKAKKKKIRKTNSADDN